MSFVSWRVVFGILLAMIGFVILIFPLQKYKRNDPSGGLLKEGEGKVGRLEENI